MVAVAFTTPRGQAERMFNIRLHVLSCMLLLRPLSIAHVLYVGITSCMSELPIDYVLYVGIASFMSGLRPVCGDMVPKKVTLLCSTEAVQVTLLI